MDAADRNRSALSGNSSSSAFIVDDFITTALVAPFSLADLIWVGFLRLTGAIGADERLETMISLAAATRKEKGWAAAAARQ